MNARLGEGRQKGKTIKYEKLVERGEEDERK